MFDRLKKRFEKTKSNLINEAGLADTIDYRYDAIPNASSVRICTLDTTSNSGPIHCSLVISNLNGVLEPYTALSYTWNDEKKPRHIYCDGSKIAVTSSLYSALKRLRVLKYRHLWIDALCINQSSTEEALSEKAQQITLMHRIFAQAEKVVVDLGEPDGHTTKALHFAREFNRKMEVIKSDANVNTAANGTKPMTFPQELSKYFEAWKHFMARRWFRRVWVIQEYALARSVEMLIGVEILNPEDVTNTAFMIWSYNKHLLFVADDEGAELGRINNAALESIDNVSMMLVLRERLLKDNPYKFAEVLGLTRQFQSTDSRDKVYALLGLSSDGDQIEVDYSISAKLVFHRAASQMIESGFTFLMLSHAGGGTKFADVPSWVPDFSKLTCISNIALEVGDPIYHAASSAVARVQHVNNLLRIDGLYYDEIAEVSMAYEDDEATSTTDFYDDHIVKSNPDLRILRWLQLVFRFVHHNGLETAYPELNPASIWRTLIGGLFEGSRDLSEASRYTEAAKDFCHWYSLTSLDASEYDMPTSFFGTVGYLKKRQDDIEHALTAPCVSYLTTMGEKVNNKRICKTRAGVLGLVPKFAQAGDTIALLLGSGLPHVLRRQKQGYRYIGNCYIDGIMDGEALKSAGDVVSFELV